MTTFHVTTALSSLLSLALVWLLVTSLYRDYRVDLFRDRMFALRERFFDEAADGCLSFDNPAYQLVRTTMNGFIRFGHRVSLTSTLITYSRFGKQLTASHRSFHTRLDEALTGATETERRCVEKYVAEMNTLVFEQLILASPLLTFPMSIWAVLEALRLVGRHALSRVFARSSKARAWAGSLDSVAMAVGQGA
jgi:hypothetical protein